MKHLAHFFSLTLHPALMPMFCVIFVKLFLPYYFPQPLFLFTLIYVGIGTFIFPLLVSLLMLKLKLISSLFLKNAAERKWPFLITAIFYFLTAKALREFTIPVEISLFLVAASLTILLSFILLRFYKISAHVAGISGFTTFIIILSLHFQLNFVTQIIAFVLFTGFIASSRLLLKAHSLSEVILGFVSAILSMNLVFYFL